MSKAIDHCPSKHMEILFIIFIKATDYTFQWLFGATNHMENWNASLHQNTALITRRYMPQTTIVRLHAVGSILAALSQVRYSWAHYPEQRLVIEPTYAVMVAVKYILELAANSGHILSQY